MAFTKAKEHRHFRDVGNNQDIKHTNFNSGEQGNMGETNISEAIQKLKEIADFDNLLEYAKGVAVLNGHTTLDLPHLAIGAWLAASKGELGDSPVLSDHLTQYQPEIKRFVATHQWRSDGVTRCRDAFHMSHEAIMAFMNAAESEQPLLTLINLGLQIVNRISVEENVAYHEIGHALVSLHLRPEIRIDKITIQREGDAGGSVKFDSSSAIQGRPTSREDAVEEICVSLAGRAAQIRKFGADAADGGAHADMQQATHSAMLAVTVLGLDQDFGPVSLDVVAKFMGQMTAAPHIPDALGEKLAKLAESGALTQEEMGFIMHKLSQGTGATFPHGYLFDEAQRLTQKMLKEAYERAKDILDKHWDTVEMAVSALLKEKTLTEAQLRNALGV